MEEEADAKGRMNAYQVKDGPDGQSWFNRIGSAFPHKDGQGFNVILDATPVDGRVTLRTAQQRLDRLKNGSEKSEADKQQEHER